MAIDKYKTCKDCPDRSAVPNCHATCEGYLERVKQQTERNEKIRKIKNADRYLLESVAKKRRKRERDRRRSRLKM